MNFKSNLTSFKGLTNKTNGNPFQSKPLGFNSSMPNSSNAPGNNTPASNEKSAETNNTPVNNGGSKFGFGSKFNGSGFGFGNGANTISNNIPKPSFGQFGNNNAVPNIETKPVTEEKPEISQETNTKVNANIEEVKEVKQEAMEEVLQSTEVDKETNKEEAKDSKAETKKDNKKPKAKPRKNNKNKKNDKSVDTDETTNAVEQEQDNKVTAVDDEIDVLTDYFYNIPRTNVSLDAAMGYIETMSFPDEFIKDRDEIMDKVKSIAISADMLEPAIRKQKAAIDALKDEISVKLRSARNKMEKLVSKDTEGLIDKVKTMNFVGKNDAIRKRNAVCAVMNFNPDNAPEDVVINLYDVYFTLKEIYSFYKDVQDRLNEKSMDLGIIYGTLKTELEKDKRK